MDCYTEHGIPKTLRRLGLNNWLIRHLPGNVFAKLTKLADAYLRSLLMQAEGVKEQLLELTRDEELSIQPLMNPDVIETKGTDITYYILEMRSLAGQRPDGEYRVFRLDARGLLSDESAQELQRWYYETKPNDGPPAAWGADIGRPVPPLIEELAREDD